jgi:probable F420-dependent oxidoreductase
VNRRIEVALPFWLDQPDTEAVDIARAAMNAGLKGIWVGEMATFDAFALATAIGAEKRDLNLHIGPLPISVRNPAGIALGASSVAALTGANVNIALGTSSPAIVAGWHGRDWDRGVRRMRETIECLRGIFDGQRSGYHGQLLHASGFRLRHPMPHATIAVGAFGPQMIRLATQYADELVLNLSTPERVAAVRREVDQVAAQRGGTAPHVTVWVPLALNPTGAALTQLAAQIAAYLAPPGYGEMFIGLGFSDLVTAARSGTRRSELAKAVPLALLEAIGAVGSSDHVLSRLQSYLDAGADTVAVVPATADDPAGHAALQLAARCTKRPSPSDSRPDHLYAARDVAPGVGWRIGNGPAGSSNSSL